MTTNPPMPDWNTPVYDTVRIRHQDNKRRGACYVAFDGWMEFNRHAFEHKYLDFTAILNHEIMHKVLEESLNEERASCLYDYAFGDYPIHSIDSEYHDATNEYDWRKV